VTDTIRSGLPRTRRPHREGFHRAAGRRPPGRAQVRKGRPLGTAAEFAVVDVEEVALHGRPYASAGASWFAGSTTGMTEARARATTSRRASTIRRWSPERSIRRANRASAVSDLLDIASPVTGGSAEVSQPPAPEGMAGDGGIIRRLRTGCEGGLVSVRRRRAGAKPELGNGQVRSGSDAVIASTPASGPCSPALVSTRSGRGAPERRQWAWRSAGAAAAGRPLRRASARSWAAAASRASSRKWITASSKARPSSPGLIGKAPSS